ncbi:hypothetical protein ML462_05710 [Gramella lutea]|uniref:Uncharacterized protein n=1 Tax=Christiangramia lutea TaxID=1607951 RepID=A0A9X1V209_9FLAO|nr:hypothetical protein [Christiangramia lutea]MCH4822664.1 hypothetical protein [Christiangramia lutea]
MKTFFKHLLFLAVIVVQSCSSNDDPDCSAVSCDSSFAILDFQIVDSETGENITESIISGYALEVINNTSDAEPNYDFIVEEDILRIYISNDVDYTVMYGDEEVFSFTADAERNTGGCCASTTVTDLKIVGAKFERNDDKGIYLIKKEIRSHFITGESLENYQAFFENSMLQMEAEEEGHVNTESLEIDVVAGEKLVFKLLTYDDPEETIADDEITKIVYFEIDPEATEFTLDPDNFEEANAVIGLSASTSFIKPIENGEISGTKISNEEWQVEIKASVGEEGDSFFIKVEESKKVFNRSTYEDVWMPIYRTHVFN